MSIKRFIMLLLVQLFVLQAITYFIVALDRKKIDKFTNWQIFTYIHFYFKFSIHLINLYIIYVWNLTKLAQLSGRPGFKYLEESTCSPFLVASCCKDVRELADEWPIWPSNTEILEMFVLYTCIKCLTFSMSTSSDSYTSAIVIWCLAAIVNRP